jgi:hypothetical protein
VAAVVWDKGEDWDSVSHWLVGDANTVVVAYRCGVDEMFLVGVFDDGCCYCLVRSCGKTGY